MVHSFLYLVEAFPIINIIKADRVHQILSAHRGNIYKNEIAITFLYGNTALLSSTRK